MQLIIGSKNLHKIREIRSILKSSIEADVLSLLDFPHYNPQDEVGATFEENAVQKALHAVMEIDSLVLSEDSGLVVPALGGKPGVNSRRFAGPNASDKENRLKLIEMLTPLPERERVGYFESCFALANKRGIVKVAKATCEGRLILEERGNRGFGYDSLFIKWDYGKTFAELEEDIKNRISHRRKALDKIIFSLEHLSLAK